MPSPDPFDRPHCHFDLSIQVELTRASHSLTVLRSCRVFGDGARSTTIDLLRADRSGFGLTPGEAQDLGRLLNDPCRHFLQQHVFPLVEDGSTPLFLYTRSTSIDDPRDYALHLAIYGMGDLWELIPHEAKVLGSLLEGLGRDGA